MTEQILLPLFRIWEDGESVVDSRRWLNAVADPEMIPRRA